MPRTVVDKAASIGALIPPWVRGTVLTNFSEQIGWIDGDKQFTYGEFYDRVTRLENALTGLGIEKYDHIATLTHNSHEGMEATYAVMEMGCVHIPVNTRLSPEETGWVINHSDASALIIDWSLCHVIAPVLNELEHIKHIIIIDGEQSAALDGHSYETLIKQADNTFHEVLTLDDEDSMAAILYTSGSTGRPKGCMVSHRALYFGHVCQSLDMVRPTINDRFAHIVSLSHGQAWGFLWLMSRYGATNICLRDMDPGFILSQVREHGINATCSSPTVINFLRLHPDWEKTHFPEGTHFHLAGSPTPLPVIEALENKGIFYGHTYGFTEGHFATHTDRNFYKNEWNDLPLPEKCKILARQGLPNLFAEVRIVRPDGTHVDNNGQETGELIARGDHCMGGFWKDVHRTREVIKNGWVYSGDLAIVHEDHYIELIDRKKDMILSGGENIASAEVERVLYLHPAVAEAAAIGIPDKKWGEAVKAIVVFKEGEEASEQEIIDFCREQLAHFKCPKSVDIIDELPRNASGKVKKFILRELYWTELDGKMISGGA